jgi:nicotinamide phosphoribosyltransferase
VFGGTTSSTGYKVLDSHIGAIYGDSINYDRAKRIFERLEDKVSHLQMLF